MINFDTFPKIDAHFHATAFDKIYFEIAKKYGVRFININTDAVIFPEMTEQENVALRTEENISLPILVCILL